MLNITNLNKIKSQLNKQTLIAVTKYVGDEEIEALLSEHIEDLGENRVQVLLDKYERYLGRGIRWHFIGHLQSKKVKKVINKIDFLHALDRLSLANEIQKYRTTPLACFLEVNISEEPNKYGLNHLNVIEFMKKIIDYDKINVIGLMGMASHTDNHGIIETQFQKLVDLKNQISLEFHKDLQLSMGMSNDYPIAINMGADFIRIGSLLYEEE